MNCKKLGEKAGIRNLYQVTRKMNDSLFFDPVDNPGPAHCIECAATISTVMPVNNAYSWNPLRWHGKMGLE